MNTRIKSLVPETDHCYESDFIISIKSVSRMGSEVEVSSSHYLSIFYLKNSIFISLIAMVLKLFDPKNTLNSKTAENL